MSIGGQLNISDLVHDVEDVRIVINLDYPSQTEDYVHRIGRTARSGTKGTAYTFFTRENAKQAPELIQLLKDSNQQVNEKLIEMSRMRHFGNSSYGNRRGFSRGYSGNMNGNRNGYSAVARKPYDNGQPGHFNNKRSRSRSPARSSNHGSSRFDSQAGSNGYHSYNNGTDAKRQRTDNDHQTYGASNGHGSANGHSRFH